MLLRYLRRWKVIRYADFHTQKQTNKRANKNIYLQLNITMDLLHFCTHELLNSCFSYVFKNVVLSLFFTLYTIIEKNGQN